MDPEPRIRFPQCRRTAGQRDVHIGVPGVRPQNVTKSFDVGPGARAHRKGEGYR